MLHGCEIADDCLILVEAKNSKDVSNIKVQKNIK